MNDVLKLCFVLSCSLIASAIAAPAPKATVPLPKGCPKSCAKPAPKPVAKPVAKPTSKPAAKTVTKPPAKPTPKATPKPVVKPPVAATALPTEKLKVAGTLAEFVMVHIPAGKIVMSSTKEPGAGEAVEVKSFWIGQKEVSWDEYDVFMFKLDVPEAEVAKVDVKTRPSLPYGAPDRGYGHEGFAAISLSSNAAVRYCEWLSKKLGKKFRLATEAEWEYACRAGAELPVKLTDEEVRKVAWVKENSEEKTHDIGTKTPNAWGIYDMLGNASEWVIAADGGFVQKGGSFRDAAKTVSSSSRAKQEIWWHDPNKPKSVWWLSDGNFAGFRIVRDE